MVTGKQLGKSNHTDPCVHIRSMDLNDQLPAFHPNHCTKFHELHRPLFAYNRHLDERQNRHDRIHPLLCMDFSSVICYSRIASRKTARSPCPIRLVSNISLFGLRDSGCFGRFRRSLEPNPWVSAPVPKSVISNSLPVDTVSSDDRLRHPK